MKVLVIGGGGREHALAWKLAQSPQGADASTSRRATAAPRATRGSKTCAITDPAALADFAQREKIALTVVGPEAPLAAGVVDLFRARGLRIFGPDAGGGAAGELEGVRQGLHAAPRHPDRALRDLRRRGRGACVCRRTRRADRHQGRRPGGRQGRGGGDDAAPRRTRRSTACSTDNTLGVQHNDGGARVVIEEFLRRRGGQLHRAVRRHERAAAGHQPGPQAPAATATRARTPAAWAPTRRRRWSRRTCTPRVMHEIILPTIAGMAADGIAVHRLPLRRADDRRARQRRRRSSSTAAWATPRPSRS